MWRETTSAQQTLLAVATPKQRTKLINKTEQRLVEKKVDKMDNVSNMDVLSESKKRKNEPDDCSSPRLNANVLPLRKRLHIHMMNSGQPSSPSMNGSSDASSSFSSPASKTFGSSPNMNNGKHLDATSHSKPNNSEFHSSASSSSSSRIEPSSPIDIESISDDEDDIKRRGSIPNQPLSFSPSFPIPSNFSSASSSSVTSPTTSISSSSWRETEKLLSAVPSPLVPENKADLYKFQLPPRKAAMNAKIDVAKTQNEEDEDDAGRPKKQPNKVLKPNNVVKKNLKKYESDSSSSSDEYSDDDSDSEKLYCYCRRPDIPGKFMIACDYCDEWFHGECVNMTAEKAEKIKRWLCKICREKVKAKREAREAKKLQQSGTPTAPTQSPNVSHNNNAATTASPHINKPKNTTSPIPSPLLNGGGGPRKCLFPSCTNPAKTNSKYCCDECGIKNAKATMKQKQQDEQQQQASLDDSALISFKAALSSQPNLSASDTDDLKTLDELLKRKKNVQESLNNVEDQMKELEKAIKLASSLFVTTMNGSSAVNGVSTTTHNDGTVTDDGEKDKKMSSLEIIDCVTCGQPVPAKTFAKHIELCFGKMTTGTHINKSLSRDGHWLCGCPTTEFSGGYCERVKKACLKHVNWESLRKAHLEQEKALQEQSLASIVSEEKVIQARVSRRQQGESASSHKTIVEA